MELYIDDKQFMYRGMFDHTNLLMRIILVGMLGILVSCYFFPFELTFLPKGVNTKIMLAALGLPLLLWQSIKEKQLLLNSYLMPATALAVIFSIVGYISLDVNHADDMAYANYIVSFATWLLAAYSICYLLRCVYGYVDPILFMNYLTGVCVCQCILALIIDNVEPVKFWVDTYISQDTVADVDFLNKVDRLYGIGAAVDVAGTRFSIVLLFLIAGLKKLSHHQIPLLHVVLYWISFVLIAVIGNMISRTTIIGVFLAMLYLVFDFKMLREGVRYETLRFWCTIIVVTIILTAIAVYFYQTDSHVQEQLRFGFEGFFNWYEKGEWTTDSTDRLNSEMWIWPESNDYQTWLIGKATFSEWGIVGTDIGYCRFVFYCGLAGLSVFSLFFVCNAWISAIRFPDYRLFFILLLSLSFIIWLKVATDLFIIYALFYYMDREKSIS